MPRRYDPQEEESSASRSGLDRPNEGRRRSAYPKGRRPRQSQEDPRDGYDGFNEFDDDLFPPKPRERYSRRESRPPHSSSNDVHGGSGQHHGDQRASQQHEDHRTAHDSSQSARGRGRAGGKGRGLRQEQHHLPSSEELLMVHNSVLDSLLREKREESRRQQHVLFIPDHISQKGVRDNLATAVQNWQSSRPSKGMHPDGLLHKNIMRVIGSAKLPQGVLEYITAGKHLDQLVGVASASSTRPVRLGMEGFIKVVIRYDLSSLQGRNMLEAGRRISRDQPSDTEISLTDDLAPMDRNARIIASVHRQR